MNDMKVPIRFIVIAALFIGNLTFGADVNYRNDFEKAELNSVPSDLLVLDGDFAVKEENGNRFLELPGAPLDTFGVLFGPSANENQVVSARIFGTSSGRKFPAFDVGLNGVGGYKLRVSPGKKLLELFRGDALKTSVPLKWESGKWTHLKLQVAKTGEKQWKVEGKCWQEGASEPAAPSLIFTDTEAPPSGRPSVSGMPYSGTPIRFDDLVVSEATR
jgi:hypothetical protein